MRETAAFRWALAAAVWATVAGCAPYRRVAPEQRDLIARGRCQAGGEPQGLIIAELGGMARGIPLGGIIVEHVETRRRFAIALGRVLAMLPVGRYRLVEWWAADREADTMHRGKMTVGIQTVIAGGPTVWGRFRLLETEQRVIALAHSEGTSAIRLGRSGEGVLEVTWSAGDTERLAVGRCLGAEQGRAHTDTAAIGGLTILLGGGAGVLSGDVTTHGALMRPQAPTPASELSGAGGVVHLGMGWSFGSDGFALHELALTFAWAGFGMTSKGTQLVLGGLDPDLGAGSATLIGLHGAVQYLARPAPHWIASPILGVGTGIAVANVGNVEPAESDPDLAWSLQVSAGVDVRVTEDLGIRAQYVLAAPLVGAALPLTHQFIVGVSIVAGGDLWW